MYNQRKTRLMEEALRPSARSVVLSAQFRAHSRADRAAQAVGEYARAVFVTRVAGPAGRPVDAESRLFVTAPRIGALVGALAGVLFMVLSFGSRLSSLGGDLAAARVLLGGSFLVMGLCAAAGWLAGMAAQAFAANGPLWRAPGYEVRALVFAPALDEAERVLRAAGAQTVWVLGDEDMQPALVEVEADYFD
jgi:hypothetical protein